MKIYLVGGAVRDRLLNLPVRERDWVVVGATEKEMLDLGFRKVGRDFPVFLHPGTAEEYALARTERKTGPGHQGFVCHASPDVTLAEDLQRRDLTINALAMDEAGELVDPWGGVRDLETRVLRHVSDAFSEDPLRILRVARFAAYLHHLDFTLAPGTRALMAQMVKDGQVEELTPERVLGELDKAMGTRDPAIFFHLLADLDAAARLWPEVDQAGVTCLERVSATTDDTESRFTAMLMNLDETLISAFCRRLRCSNARTDNALLVARHFGDWCRADRMNAGEIVGLLTGTDAFRKRDRFLRFNQTCSHLPGGREAVAARWLQLLEAAATVNARNLTTDASGPALGELVRAARVEAVRAIAGD